MSPEQQHFQQENSEIIDWTDQSTHKELLPQDRAQAEAELPKWDAEREWDQWTSENIGKQPIDKVSGEPIHWQAPSWQHHIINEATNGHVTEDAEYYSGLPANEIHLNGTDLLNIYHELQRRVGNEHAQQFAHMVHDMTDFSPTNFAIQFQQFCNHFGHYTGLKGQDNFVTPGDEFLNDFIHEIAATEDHSQSESVSAKIKREFVNAIEAEGQPS